MVQSIIHDEAFLQIMSTEATQNDLPIAVDLLDTLIANRETCVGLAANMIGHSKAIIAISDEGQPLVMLNPQIIRRSIPYETEEGCLSLTGIRKTTRYRSVRVQYQDMKMVSHTRTFIGFTAQIIQHEVDHLSGILI